MDVSEGNTMKRATYHMTRDTIATTSQWASTELDMRMKEVETAKDTEKRHDCNNYK